MFELLDKYEQKGFFEFSITESLRSKCTAPTTHSGVYLIYKIVHKKEVLIYIGSSGRKGKDGELKNRMSGLGGMKDRIVNGYHPKFGKIKRYRSWPKQMELEGIKTIKVYWWVTYNNHHKDFPTDIEDKLLGIYSNNYHKKPDWHK